MRSLIFVLQVLSCLSGCQVGTFEDASNHPDLTSLRGSTYRLSDKLVAIGVTLDQNYQGGVDMIYLVPDPGFSGPEVKAREYINAGATVKVDGALVLRGMLPGEKLFFVLSGIQCSFCDQAKVVVRASSVNGKPVLPDAFVADRGGGN